MAQIEPATDSPRATRRRRIALMAIAVLVAFVAWEILTRVVAYTSDAYVRSDFVAVAPEVGGRIVAVPIHDNQTVHRGDLLFVIDPEPFRLALDAALAAVREASAQAAADKDTEAAAAAEKQSAAATLVYARGAQQRVRTLEARSTTLSSELDAADEALRRATAALVAANALEDKARETLATDAAAKARAQWPWRSRHGTWVAPVCARPSTAPSTTSPFTPATPRARGNRWSASSMPAPGELSPTTRSISCRA